ncbi:hypothetical protein CTKZ_09400 [Cellulomonas algicola]|uniref:Uncharacterized protein n=1 Tax=Cellulomonas algicola TaxID=2071633 RepID=A0A401UXJ7_9CELL|nr:hypothetical protein CTKZ_09400 [Cellulomonas algicola]
MLGLNRRRGRAFPRMPGVHVSVAGRRPDTAGSAAASGARTPWAGSGRTTSPVTAGPGTGIDSRLGPCRYGGQRSATHDWVRDTRH